jgi:hypothetical protein
VKDDLEFLINRATELRRDLREKGSYDDRPDTEETLRITDEAIEIARLRYGLHSVKLRTLYEGYAEQKQHDEEAEKKKAARRRARYALRDDTAREAARNPVAVITDRDARRLEHEIRDARQLTELPFYSPTKAVLHDEFEWRGHDGRFLKVSPLHKLGRPNIYDKRIVVYAMSITAQAMRTRTVTSRYVETIPANYFEFLGLSDGAKNYLTYQDGVKRLMGSPIETNVGSHKRDLCNYSFSGVFKDANFEKGYDPITHTKRRARAITLEWSNWAMELLQDNQLLLLDHRYLSLPPLQQRLYELGTYHTSFDDPGHWIPVCRTRLRAKIGREPLSEDPEREHYFDQRFGDDLTRTERQIAEQHGAAGLYGIDIEHDAQHVRFRRLKDAE